MKVRITTQNIGSFDAELDEGATVADLFAGDGSTVSFNVVADGAATRVTMLRSLIRVVEEEPVWESPI